MIDSSNRAALVALELDILDAESEPISSSDLYAWLREAGLPSEVSMRLTKLVEATRVFAGKVIRIGKILLIKIIEFVKMHPNLATGIAVGAAIAALVGLVPIMGSFLAPIAIAAGVGLGAVAGYRLDRQETGDSRINHSQPLLIAEDIIQIARDFFRLIATIFNAVFSDGSSTTTSNA